MCGYQEGLCVSLSGDCLGTGEAGQAREGKEGCWSSQQLLPPSPGFPGTGMGATGTFQSTLINSVSVCKAPHARLSPLERTQPFFGSS